MPAIFAADMIVWRVASDKSSVTLASSNLKLPLQSRTEVKMADQDTQQDKQKKRQWPRQEAENEDVQERRPGGGYNYTREHDDWAGNEPERRDDSTELKREEQKRQGHSDDIHPEEDA